MHGIEIRNDGRALYASARIPAWHTLGKVVDDDTITLADAGLAEWDIKPRPVFVQTDDGFLPVSDKLGQVFTRVIDGREEALSMVGPHIVPHQNEHLEVFARAMLERGVEVGQRLIFDSAGSLMDGRRVFLAFRIPGTFDIGGDTIERWLIVETSHDGRGATRAFVAYIRVVCYNTLSAAASAAANKFVIRHTGPVFPELAHQALEVLNLHLKVDPVLAGIVEEWQDTKVTDSQFDQIVRRQVPDAPKIATDRQKRTVERKRGLLFDLWDGPTVGEFKGTKWGAVNAFTEAYQWAPGSKTSAESLAKRQLVGAAPQERAVVRAIDEVLALV